MALFRDALVGAGKRFDRRARVVDEVGFIVGCQPIYVGSYGLN